MCRALLGYPCRFKTLLDLSIAYEQGDWTAVFGVASGEIPTEAFGDGGDGFSVARLPGDAVREMNRLFSTVTAILCGLDF